MKHAIGDINQCHLPNSEQIIKSNKKTLAINRHMIAKTVVIAVMLILVMVFYIIKSNSVTCENIVRNFTFLWVEFWGRIFEHVGFSIFELSCAIGVAVAIWLLASGIYFFTQNKPKRAINHLLTIVAVVACILAIYTSVTTIAYNRQPLDISMAINEEITDDKVVLAANNFYQKKYEAEVEIQKNYLAADGTSACPYNFKQLSQKIRDEFAKLEGDYFPDYIPTSKKIANSWLMSQFGIAGITFVPFGEGNINARARMSETAFTIAHEMAHTVGVMREYEANILATYVLLNSEDAYLKYIGFSNASFFELLLYSNNYQAYNELVERYYPPDSELNVMMKDNNAAREFWKNNNAFQSIGIFFNNLYLKLQGVDQGTDSYDEDISADEEEGSSGEIIFSNVQYSDMAKMLFKMFDY